MENIISYIPLKIAMNYAMLPVNIRIRILNMVELLFPMEMLDKGRRNEDRNNMTGNNHGSLECINGQWYIFYHRHTHKSTFSRQVWKRLRLKRMEDR